jgi:hypothetical protein
MHLVWAASLKVKVRVLVVEANLLLDPEVWMKLKSCGKFVPVTVMLSPPKRFRLFNGIADVIVQVMVSAVNPLALGILPFLVTISGKWSPQVGSFFRVH